MPEHPPVLLRKLSGGGCTVWHDGEPYTWPDDDPVAEVPYDLAVALLGIPDGGYRTEEAAGLAASQEGGDSDGSADAAPAPQERPATDKPKAAASRRAPATSKSAKQ